MVKKVLLAAGDAELCDVLAEDERIELLRWDMQSPAPVCKIDIVVPPYLESSAILRRLQGVETSLVQWQSIGYDGVRDNLPAGLTLANAASVHEASTAELAVGLAIAAQRGIPQAVLAAQRGAWEPKMWPALADSRVLLVGYGGVSMAIEARLQPFEVEITRIASTARTEKNLAGDEVQVFALADLPCKLQEADIVIIGLPLNDATRHLFDAQLLAQMPDGALLVNVGRGPIVVTDALVAELNSGRLRAALDVVDPEPLPKEHALWSCPNLLLTPHVGGDSVAMLPRIVRLIGRQVDHFLNGEPFENVVLS